MANERDTKSPLWSMGALGAVGGGFAYGMKGNWRDLYSSVKGISDIGPDIVSSLSQSAIRYDPLAYSSTMEALGSRAIDPRHAAEFGQQISTFAYESLTGAKIPTGHPEAKNAMRRILEYSGTGAPPIDVYRFAGSEIEKLGGDINAFNRRVNRVQADPALLEHAISRFKGIKLATKSLGIIPYEKLTTIEQKELSYVLNRLRGSDIGFKELIELPSGDIDYRLTRVGKEGVAMAKIGVRGIGDIEISLSGAHTPAMYRGEAATRYIARGAWGIEVTGVHKVLKTKTFNEHYLDEIAKSLTKSGRDRAGIKEAINATNRGFSWGIMDDAGEALAKAAVWVPDPEMMTAGGLMREQMLGRQLVYAGKNLTPELLEKAIELSAKTKDPLTPFLGASGVGKGTLIAGDIRQQFYGPLGELFPAEKAPFQFVREEWGLTKEAMHAATKQKDYQFRGTFGEHTKRLLEKTGMGENYREFIGLTTQAKAEKVYTAPKMMTLFTTGREGATKFMSPEEGWVRRSAGELQEYERIRGVRIRTGVDMPAHKALIGAIETTPSAIGEHVVLSQAIPLERGELLGITSKGFKREMVRPGPGMTQELVGFKRTAEGEAIAALREVQVATPGMPRKFFGQGDIKHLMHSIDDEEFARRVTEDLGFSKAKQRLVGQNIEQALVGERLIKNPYARFRQQITAMDVLVSARIDRANKTEATRLRNLADPFFKNDTAFLEDVFANKKIETQAELEYQVQRRIVEQAKKLGISRGVTGELIFGRMEGEIDRKTGQFTGHIRKLLKEGVITKAQATRFATAEHITGMSAPYMGDLAYEGGTGKMGKMDVGGFRLLAQKKYAGVKDFGAAAAIDIAERTIAPSAQAEISRMHASIIGAPSDDFSGLKRALMGGEEAVDLATTTGSLAQREGRLYGLGKGAVTAGLPKEIYIPGMEQAGQLGPSLTTEGEILESELHRRATGLRSAIQQGDSEAIQAAHQRLAQASHKEFARSSVIQGKVIGSRIFTGTQQIVTQATELGEEGVMGISKATGTKMFEEMMENAPEGRREFLLAQKEAFLAKETMAGMSWRHPNVGPESVQIAKYKLLEGAQDTMIHMPEMKADITIGGEVLRGKDVSPMVGFKGDFDKDQFVLSAIGDRDVSQRANKALANDAGIKYNQYLGRHYSMERMIDQNLRAQGVSAETMRGVQALQQQTRAHGYAKIATGQTNIALQQAKIALAAGAPGQYDELATAMWHLEETAAIGSKHGLDIGQGGLYKRIGSAVRNKNEVEMANVFRSILGEKQQMTSVVRGAQTVLDYDPDIYARKIIGAIKQMPDEVSEAIKLSSLATKGESRATAQAMIDQYLMTSQRGSPDVAATLSNIGKGEIGLGAKMKMGGWKVRRRMRAVGQILSRAKKPLALGAAAAGVIALAAPTISGRLSNPNLQNAAGGKNIDVTDSIPTSGPEMSIPSKGILRSPRVYDTGKMATRVKTRYNANDIETDRATIMRQVAAMRNNGTNVRMQVKDDRAALDPHMLANKIHERM